MLRRDWSSDVCSSDLRNEVQLRREILTLNDQLFKLKRDVRDLQQTLRDRTSQNVTSDAGGDHPVWPRQLPLPNVTREGETLRHPGQSSLPNPSPIRYHSARRAQNVRSHLHTTKFPEPQIAQPSPVRSQNTNSRRSVPDNIASMAGFDLSQQSSDRKSVV